MSDGTVPTLEVTLRSFLAGDDTSSARLRALLLDDLGGTGRGHRELVDATVRGWELGVADPTTEQRTIHNTLTAEYGQLIKAQTLTAWDAALGRTPGTIATTRNNTPVLIGAFAALAVGLIAIVAIASSTDNSDDHVASTGGAGDVIVDVPGTDPIGDVETTSATLAVPTTVEVVVADTAPEAPEAPGTPPEASTGPTTNQQLPLAAAMPGLDLTSCVDFSQYEGRPAFVESKQCRFDLSGDLSVWNSVTEADIGIAGRGEAATYVLELTLWADQSTFERALSETWTIDRAQPVVVPWADDTSSGIIVNMVVNPVGREWESVSGKLWTYDNAMIVALGYPIVDPGSTHLQLFVDTFFPLGP